MLGRRPQSKHDWEHGNSLLLERETAGGRGKQAARERTLSYEQLIEAAGSLETAAAHLGLDHDSQPIKPASLTAADAIAVFYSEHGYLPTKADLEAFRSKRAFGLASLKGRRWDEWIAAGIERIGEFPQLPAPPPYGVKKPPKGWKPTQLPIDLPPPASRLYSHLDVLQAVDICLRKWLPTSRFKRLTDRAWRDYCRGKPGIPSLHVTKQHGGIDYLIKDVAIPGWEARAASWVDKRPRLAERYGPAKTPREQIAREQARIRAAVLRPTPQAIVALVHERGECSAREIREALNLSRYGSQKHLRNLVQAGLLHHTHPLGSRKQGYTLPPPGGPQVPEPSPGEGES